MCATEGLRRQSSRRGAATVAALILSITVAALCMLMVSAARASNQKARARLETQKAFYMAEGGLDFALSQIQDDAEWPLTNTTRFPTVDADGATLRSTWIPLGDGTGDFQIEVRYQKQNSLPAGWTDPGLPPGWSPVTNLAVGDRSSTPSGFQRFEISVVGRFGESRRTVRANVSFESKLFGSAIVSDSPSANNDISTGKGAAKDDWNVSLKGSRHFIYGGIHANGKILSDEVTGTVVSDDNSGTAFASFDGDIQQELYGTADEIPDFTNPGSAQQLFDFGRFEAAAAAGAGQVINGIDEFETIMEAANALGTPLEGIIYLKIDAAEEGGSPEIDFTGGVNIKGTLVFDFTNQPDDFYKVFIKCPLNINAATLPADFDPADVTTCTTGYPPTISAGKDPRGFAIGSAIYEDFEVDADLPALMFDTGTVDIHDAANVCGAVYGPSFIEIENKSNKLQYFNGSILGGGGIYLESGNGVAAQQVIVYDPSAVNSLPTFGDTASTPTISGYIIGD